VVRHQRRAATVKQADVSSTDQGGGKRRCTIYARMYQRRRNAMLSKESCGAVLNAG